ncbi:uncharacterized protein LOC129589879 isoform X2 [Paramacrobiotus metropolitanus]|uniref:uncharacterized protein LOC129589879 isoform X2 n=1 Tax=Paramacrobiotus metropolitanus TaxID=2943436 RepID=UPI00244617EA|nr:uncharacterized protein LOC129589879 isoform X2 [Paramacrobiotus metropolitanus]
MDKILRGFFCLPIIVPVVLLACINSVGCSSHEEHSNGVQRYRRQAPIRYSSSEYDDNYFEKNVRAVYAPGGNACAYGNLRGSYQNRMNYKARTGGYLNRINNRQYDYGNTRDRSKYNSGRYADYPSLYGNNTHNGNYDDQYSYRNLTKDYPQRSSYKKNDYYDSSDRSPYKPREYGRQSSPRYRYDDYTYPDTCPQCPQCPATCPSTSTMASSSAATPAPDDDDQSSSPAPISGVDSNGLLVLPSDCDLQSPTNDCYLKKQSTPFRCTQDQCAQTKAAQQNSGVKIFAPSSVTVSQCVFRKYDTLLFTYNVCQIPQAKPFNLNDVSKGFACGGVDTDCFKPRPTSVSISEVKKCGVNLSSATAPFTLQCTLSLSDGSNVLDAAVINITVLPDCRC